MKTLDFAQKSHASAHIGVDRDENLQCEIHSMVQLQNSQINTSTTNRNLLQIELNDSEFTGQKAIGGVRPTIRLLVLRAAVSTMAHVYFQRAHTKQTEIISFNSVKS